MMPIIEDENGRRSFASSKEAYGIDIHKSNLLKLSEVDFDLLNVGDRVISAIRTRGHINGLYREGEKSPQHEAERFNAVGIVWDHGGTSHVFHHQADSVEFEFQGYATVDQMIAMLQKLSAAGKGNHRCFGVGNHKERYHSHVSPPLVDDIANTVDLTPYGAYYP